MDRSTNSHAGFGMSDLTLNKPELSEHSTPFCCSPTSVLPPLPTMPPPDPTASVIAKLRRWVASSPDNVLLSDLRHATQLSLQSHQPSLVLPVLQEEHDRRKRCCYSSESMFHTSQPELLPDEGCMGEKSPVAVSSLRTVFNPRVEVVGSMSSPEMPVWDVDGSSYVNSGAHGNVTSGHVCVEQDRTGFVTPTRVWDMDSSHWVEHTPKSRTAKPDIRSTRKTVEVDMSELGRMVVEEDQCCIGAMKEVLAKFGGIVSQNDGVEIDRVSRKWTPGPHVQSSNISKSETKSLVTPATVGRNAEILQVRLDDVDFEELRLGAAYDGESYALEDNSETPAGKICMVRQKGESEPNELVHNCPESSFDEPFFGPSGPTDGFSSVRVPRLQSGHSNGPAMQPQSPHMPLSKTALLPATPIQSFGTHAAHSPVRKERWSPGLRSAPVQNLTSRLRPASRPSPSMMSPGRRTRGAPLAQTAPAGLRPAGVVSVGMSGVDRSQEVSMVQNNATSLGLAAAPLPDMESHILRSRQAPMVPMPPLKSASRPHPTPTVHPVGPKTVQRISKSPAAKRARSSWLLAPATHVSAVTIPSVSIEGDKIRRQLRRRQNRPGQAVGSSNAATKRR